MDNEQAAERPTPDEVDDAVDRWHKNAGFDMALHDYLGWSWREYSTWVSDPSAIPARPLPVGLSGNGQPQ